ncbi:hypothetical protein KQR54_32090 [Mycobacterium gordonae]|uniref:hypothetical protein n=1 Tax=Mycobacterium gordonae TaxID=1778 RepID=UPI00210E98D7|nr:hypothetical protein [Mycobacterium gordonae]MCQ4365687.1 hypothetical protein [Mycobacterium gordonae]
MDAYERRVRRLLKVAGTTYAEQAGIRLDAAIAVRAAKGVPAVMAQKTTRFA